jgi:hypothetical protein
MGTESFWLPAAMGGMGALGGALGGGEGRGMYSFGQDHGHPDPLGIGDWGHIFPPTLLANYMSNVEQLGGLAAARAAQPITLPGTQVQPTPWYGGGGMVMPVGLTGMDVANIRPSILGTPGVRFPEPDPGAVAAHEMLTPYGPDSSDARKIAERSFRENEMTKFLFSGAPRETAASQVETFSTPIAEGGQFEASLPQYQGMRQPSPSPIMPGGGFSELFGALKLLGVEQDPMGNLTMGSEYPLFTGAARPQQLVQKRWSPEMVEEAAKPLPSGISNPTGEDQDPTEQ